MFAKLRTYLEEAGDEFAFNVLLALTAALFMLQLLSLFTTPIPDSYLWWGDESWLMIEFRTQILEGVFRHPYALGSSLEHGSGLLFGNMWIPVVLYGLPASLFKNGIDIILIGRTITALLSASLLIALFECVRRLTGDRVVALFGVLLLLSSRSFLFTSHSARYDILTSLSILIGVYFILRLTSRHRSEEQPPAIHSAKYAILVGACVTLSLIITVHVALALWLAAFVGLMYISRGQRLLNCGSFFIGGAVVALILVAVSALRGQVSLFGSVSANAFSLNLHDIPFLRPFSRSVQFSNVLQRWRTLSTLGLGYLIALLVVSILAVFKYVQKKLSFALDVRFGIVAIILFSWFEFESAAPTSYLIYVLPVLSVAIALVAWRTLPIRGREWIVLFAGIALTICGLTDAWRVRSVGRDISKANDRAVNDALGQVIHGSEDPHPIVLTFNPAVHDVLMDTSVRLMTTHLVEFPSEVKSGSELTPTQYAIKKAHVRYILLYRSGLKPDYMREAGPITDAAYRLGVRVWQQTGVFTDIGRSYFDAQSGTPDTLQLYHLYD